MFLWWSNLSFCLFGHPVFWSDVADGWLILLKTPFVVFADVQVLIVLELGDFSNWCLQNFIGLEVGFVGNSCLYGDLESRFRNPDGRLLLKFFLNFVCCSWLSFCGVIEYFFFSLYRFFFYLKDIQLWFVFIMSVFSLFKRNWFEVFQVNWLREDFVFTVYVYEASV